MYYPKVLVISNNGFSHTSSNGRTLGNFFIGWPKDCVAQFCISTVEPAFDICENYYICTDSRAIEAFKHFSKAPRMDIMQCLNTEANTIIRSNRKSFKTSTKALLRALVWKNRWNSDSFWNWVDDFSPEIVLVMNSDATFILDIATTVSKKRTIPLVMFNTEGFYFFKNDYYRKERFVDTLSFPIYQSIYKKHFEKTMKQVSLSIYCNSALQEDYVNEFGGKSIVLYTGSTLDFDSSNLHVEHPTFSYLGNFGYNRPKALVEVAETLQSICHNYFLDIYGNVPRQEIIDLFTSTRGIRFHGMIPYDKVTEIIKRSTVLFHVEAQDECFKESLKYGFSTKIADSVSSGRCFIIYSSPEVAGAKYIQDTRAGWFADNVDDLKTVILSVLLDADNRENVLVRAKRISFENHNVNNNCDKFKQALLSVLN